MTDIINSVVVLLNFVIIPGLSYGSQLALGALGVTFVYAILRFANFAHGELMSFGAMITILFTWFFQSQNIGLGILPTALLALPFGILATIILGLLSDKFVFKYYRTQKSVPVVLAMVSIGVSLFFAEISGSAVADVAALGSILIPEMKKRGYGAPFAAAVTSSSASLAIIIPPSIPMILYAVSANTSVEQLFVAGFIPGLMGATGLMGVSWWFARRYNLPVEKAFNWPRLRHAAIEAGPTFLLPIIILGGIFGGFVTATEAAGLAVLAAIGVGIWYREVDFRQLHRAMLEGGMQTAVVMVLVAASVLMGGFLTRAQIPQELAAQMVAFTDSKYVMNGVTDWMARWKANGWRTAAKKPVANQDLWELLDEATQRHQITWHWVKGHAGHPLNERCDVLARSAAEAIA